MEAARKHASLKIYYAWPAGGKIDNAVKFFGEHLSKYSQGYFYDRRLKAKALSFREKDDDSLLKVSSRRSLIFPNLFC